MSTPKGRGAKKDVPVPEVLAGTLVGRERYPRAWWIANTFRLAEGLTRCIAMTREERGETAGDSVIEGWVGRLLRLHAESQSLGALDLPRTVREPESVVKRVRQVAEVLGREWDSWLRRSGPLEPEDHPFLQGLLHELRDLYLELDHAIAAAGSSVAWAPDYSWLAVRGKTYHFGTPRQRKVIELLAMAWESSGRQDGCGLHQEYIAEGASPDSARLRIDRIFKDHPALGTILRSSPGGMWALHLGGCEAG